MAPVTHGGNIFAVARQHNWDWRDILDFSASINPLGPSPAVSTALCRAVERITHYPERDGAELRRTLSHAWLVDERLITVGNGATELLFFLSRLLSGESVTLALPVFSEFHRAFPSAAFADVTDPGTWPDKGLLVLTRPVNPTGFTLPLEWIAQCPAAILVDESFIDFSNHPSAATLLDTRPNVMVLRSLTKFYAIPGLRAGALLTSRDLSPQREPWQLNALAEQAAIAAVEDTAHANRTREFIHTEREWLRAQLNAPASDANFLHIPLARPAAPLTAALLNHKILIRDCAGWPGVDPQSVRIAVRTREQNERLLSAWRKIECV